MENKSVPMCQKDQLTKISLTEQSLKNLQDELTTQVTHCGFQHILDKCFLVFPTPQKADLIYSSNTKYLEHVIIMFKRYFSGMSQGLRVKFRLECLGRGDEFALSPGKAVITKLCVTTPSRDRRPSNDSVSINKVKCSGTL